MQWVKATVAEGICEEIDLNLKNRVIGGRAILERKELSYPGGKMHILKVQIRLHASPSEI